jgi:hypothetical protein
MPETLSRIDAFLWSRTDLQPSDLAYAVATTHRKPLEHIVVETLISEGPNPLNLLDLQGHLGWERGGSDTVPLVRVEDPDGPFVLAAWPAGPDGVFHLTGSVPRTDPRWKKVERLIAGLTPDVVPCYLNHADFTAIGTALTEHGEVEVRALSARKRIDHSGYNRSWPILEDRLRPDHHDALAEAEAEGASVRTLTLHVAERLDVHLRRRAGATYYGGNFDLFANVVMGRLTRAAEQRRQLMTGRAREVGAIVPAPIQIRLDDPIFTDATATGDLLNEVAGLRDLSMAVMHRNPYLHVAVSDLTDGSNYDVFVTSPDSIEIHPGFRASMGSLSRLSQALGERFEATEIGEATPSEPVSLYDLMAD